MKKLSFISTLLVALATSVAHADGLAQLKPPQALEYEGKNYQLTSSTMIAESNGNRLFYHYTTGNETLDQWTSQVIIQFAPHVHLKGEAWANDVKAYFDASDPRPYYRIDSIGGNPFARHLNPPINENPSESSVMRFFSNGCGGQVVLQYLEKIDASNLPFLAGFDDRTFRCQRFGQDRLLRLLDAQHAASPLPSLLDQHGNSNIPPSSVCSRRPMRAI